MSRGNGKKGATPGFDIVQYTGNKTNRTISHSLGVAPEWIVIKDYSNTESWNVGHNSIGWTKNLFLNLTNGRVNQFIGLARHCANKFCFSQSEQATV